MIHRFPIDVSTSVTAAFVTNCGTCRLKSSLELSMNDVVRLAKDIAKSAKIELAITN